MLGRLPPCCALYVVLLCALISQLHASPTHPGHRARTLDLLNATNTRLTLSSYQNISDVSATSHSTTCDDAINDVVEKCRENTYRYKGDEFSMGELVYAEYIPSPNPFQKSMACFEDIDPERQALLPSMICIHFLVPIPHQVSKIVSAERVTKGAITTPLDWPPFRPQYLAMGDIRAKFAKGKVTKIQYTVSSYGDLSFIWQYTILDGIHLHYGKVYMDGSVDISAILPSPSSASNVTVSNSTLVQTS